MFDGPDFMWPFSKSGFNYSFILSKSALNIFVNKYYRTVIEGPA